MNFLLTFIYLFSTTTIQGFEVPMLVFFTTSLKGSHNDEVMSRCKSKLILICKEDDADRFVSKGSYSNNHAKRINVEGKLNMSSFALVFVKPLLKK